MHKRTMLLSTAAKAMFFGAVLAPAARAQSAPPTPAAANTGSGIEQVVVTAQKRQASAQKTPISMTVYKGKTLAAKGVYNVQTLSAIDPSVNFSENGGLATITMRGVGSHDTSEIGDPAVAIATDGFFLNRPYSLSSTLYDLDRIEVLRGPQGTLYGRNAAGGLLNIITAKPVDKFGGAASLEYGNYNTLNSEAMLNVPISDRLQIRGAFASQNHNGYRNTPPFGQGDDQDSKSGRVEVAFQPFDGFSGNITLQDTNIGGVGQVEKRVPFSYQADGINPMHDQPTLGDINTIPLGAPLYTRLDDRQLRWEFNYDGLPYGVRLTYLGGYDSTNYHHADDNTVPGSPPDQFVENESPKTQNHELRLSSPSRGRLTWQTGLFYFNETSALDSYDLVHFGAPYGNARVGEYLYPTVATHSYAGYGQATYKLTSKVAVTAGARYTSDDKVRTGNFLSNLTSTPPILTSPVSVYGSSHSSKITWHGGVDYNPTPQNLLYAHIDTGYKAGGFTVYSPYAPETVTSYEIGSKNRFLHNTLQANMSLFYEDYSGLQVSQSIPGTSESAIQNAGSSAIYGVEGDVVALLQPIGQLDFSVAYLDAHFTRFLAGNATGTANVELSGNVLPQSPRWSINAGLQRSVALKWATLTGRIETKFQSKQYYSFFNYADTAQGNYTMSNATLTIAPNRSRWQLLLYVRNLENAVVFTDAIEDYNASAYTYGFYAPRTYGAKLSFTW